MRKSLLHVSLALTVALMAAGCESMGSNGGLVASHNGNPPEDGNQRAVAADDRTLAKKHFRNGDYGLAERHYRRAVERRPEFAENWVGLAASYDQLGRFDMADRAYKNALKLAGPIPAVLNNQGYSYLLRGDYAKARQLLRRAHNADPTNRHVNGNLELLDQKARQASAEPVSQLPHRARS